MDIKFEVGKKYRWNASLSQVGFLVVGITKAKGDTLIQVEYFARRVVFPALQDPYPWRPISENVTISKKYLERYQIAPWDENTVVVG